ncbi:MAG: endolytic transglycosylase MltG [Pseudomonadota bacterium]
MRRVLLSLGVLTGCALLAAAAFATSYYRFLNTPIPAPAEPLVFVVEPGSTFSGVTDELTTRGVISHPSYFRLHGRLTGLEGSIQAGEYAIDGAVSPKKLLARLVSGSVVLHDFTIIEGWNRWELLDALKASDVLVDDLDEADWATYLESIGSEHSYPEGLFLPETYRFPRGTPVTSLLENAYDALQTTLAEEWEGRSQNAAVATPYEALTLASIIEKETARVDERQRISGVFTRRLNLRMRLQTDPTVIYGLLPGFNGDLTFKDLRTDTPYNTRTRRGLPPTPIAMAGRAAIHAALHPADGEELYFVATGLDDGSHVFSNTLEEHNRAVQAYLKQLRSRRSEDAP